MHDTLVVRRLQRFRDLLRDRQRLIQWKGASRDPLRQIFSLDELHDDGAHVTRFLEAVDVSDVGMVQRGEHLGLAGESRKPVGIAGERVWQDLQRDIAIEPRVAGPKHLAHPAYADRREDLVAAESSAGRHPKCWIIRLCRKAATITRAQAAPLWIDPNARPQSTTCAARARTRPSRSCSPGYARPFEPSN